MKTPNAADATALRELETELDAIEARLGTAIDDYMSGLYLRNNATKPHHDVDGLSGRWNNWQRETTV